MKRYFLHPACELFPKLPEKELQELADDIQANGLQNPIVLLDNKILDGRNRYAACKLAKVQPKFTKWDGEGSPLAWVISQNMMRRHLTASQRAVVALDVLPLLEKEAKERQRKRNGKVAHKCATMNEKASEAAARLAKSSARYVEMAKAIGKDAPDLLGEVRTGELSLTDANKQLRIRQETDRARKNRRNRKRALATEEDAERVVHGDCMDLIPALPDESINLVVTSPPYAEQRKGNYKGVPEAKYPEWTVNWMRLIRDKLADDGSILIVLRPHIKNGQISDYVLRTRLALRDDGWNECEELIWLKSDAPPLGSTKRPRRTWESILWFSKTTRPYVDLTACGKESSRLGFAGSLRFGAGGKSPVGKNQTLELKNGVARQPDVFVASVGTIEKEVQHPAMFPESLAEQLILTFSRKNDLVGDVFAGAGSTLCSAKRLERDFWGCDFSKRYVNLARRRLSEITS